MNEYTIYRIVNTKNKKSYIGMTVDIERRIKDHFYKSTNNRLPKNEFQEQISKLGAKNFICMIIDKAFSKKDAQEKEKYWIKFYKTDQHYNSQKRNPKNRNRLFLVMNKTIIERLKVIAEIETRKTGLPIKANGLASKIIKDWIDKHE